MKVEGKVKGQVVLFSRKRHIVKFFNTNVAAKKMRLDGHGHEQILGKKKQSVTCYKIDEKGKKQRAEMMVWCEKCGLGLCIRRKLLMTGYHAKMSCWERHHTMARLKQD